MDENFTVKLCDFGLSAFQKTKTLQDKGVAPGTPLWMGPEVLQGMPLTEKVDVYSFAMVLWEMLTGKEPYEEFDSYDVFVDAVCFQNERPDFPEGFPECLKKLVSSCWDQDVPKRPSFTEIVDLLNIAMVEISIVNDNDAAVMWRSHWNGELSVSWNKFVTTFYSHFDFHFDERDEQYKCLKRVLCPDSQEETVTLDRFGNFLKWFGPCKSKAGSILARLSNLLKYKWFHGDLTRENSETRLNEFGKGTFLVRLSSTEPIERAPFTISKVHKTGEINHQRVYAKTEDGLGYFTHVKYKNGTKKVEADGGIENLLLKVLKDLSLRKECPGWPYSNLFTTVDSSYNIDPDVEGSNSDEA